MMKDLTPLLALLAGDALGLGQGLVERQVLESVQGVVMHEVLDGHLTGQHMAQMLDHGFEIVVNIPGPVGDRLVVRRSGGSGHHKNFD